jgi:nicotinate-nucleotide adenylyltransferase
LNITARRIGLFGGTFDPVHNGHLQIAETARALCDLQEIWFIPAAVPPHKNLKAVASFKHRVKMIELALTGRPEFTLSTIEASLPEPSYTIDTLRHFHTHTAIATDFFFIIGADAFLDITTWKSYRQVLQSTHIVALSRAGSVSEKIIELIQRLGYKTDTHESWLHPVFHKKIFFFSLPVIDLSSSRIRQNIKDNLPVPGAVPPAVLDYIRAHGLYT